MDSAGSAQLSELIEQHRNLRLELVDSCKVAKLEYFMRLVLLHTRIYNGIIASLNRLLTPSL